MHACPSSFLFHDGIFQRSICVSVNRMLHCFRETLPEFGANARVPRQRVLQFRVSLR